MRTLSVCCCFPIAPLPLRSRTSEIFCIRAALPEGHLGICSRYPRPYPFQRKECFCDQPFFFVFDPFPEQLGRAHSIPVQPPYSIFWSAAHTPPPPPPPHTYRWTRCPNTLYPGLYPQTDTCVGLFFGHSCYEFCYWSLHLFRPVVINMITRCLSLRLQIVLFVGVSCDPLLLVFCFLALQGCVLD